MRFNLKKVTLLAAWAISAENTAYPEDAMDKLQPLIVTSASRLGIAEQVALAKWDNGMPVEDASREDQPRRTLSPSARSRRITSVSD